LLIWDNYPVNDGEMRWDPHIRPLRGRGPDLPAACSGIVTNGAIEPEATKIALHTLAAYWRDPAAMTRKRRGDLPWRPWPATLPTRPRCESWVT
ncbi:MAG: protein O-GlcNAcase, partial [Chloroflexota bacterium]|nr:protein O-GlcNAcase [Chloroflexota bacterium]